MFYFVLKIFDLYKIKRSLGNKIEKQCGNREKKSAKRLNITHDCPYLH